MGASQASEGGQSQQPAPTIDELYNYSRKLWEARKQNESKYESLPYLDAYELMVGTTQKDPLWKRIKEGRDLPLDEKDMAQSIVRQYPDPLRLPEFKEKQQNYAKLFDVDIRFDKYDVRFANDLINKINEGRLLSVKQFERVKYFIYRYREQLRDQIIYEENGSERLYDYLDPDRRMEFDNIIAECEDAHEKVNNRY